jgi:Tol biopolymer transport system component/DNA-binding winged helix-turn-helix (wHTH) protein
VARKYEWDGFVLDLDAYSLEREGAVLALEPKAFNLLAFLIERPGRVLTKQEIFDAVWPGTVVSDHALTRVVAQIRRVLGDEAREARYIETVPTRGYRWLPRVKLVADASLPQAEVSAPATTAPEAAPPRRSYFPGFVAGLTVASMLLVAAAWNERATPGAAPSSPQALRSPVQVTTNPGLDLHPAFSPQGDAIAYVSDRSGGLEIYVRGLVDTAAESALTDNGGQNVQPVWSPDGRLIAFHSARDGGIWVVPGRGGVARQIVASGADPAWSPDGRYLAYKSDEHADVTPSAFGAQSGSTLWMVEAGGGVPRQLTREGQPLGGHAAPAWSNDGRYIAFSVFEGGPNNGVWLLSVDTREPTPLETGGRLYELVFGPDDSALYAAGGEPMIVRLPFDAKAGKLSGPRELIPVPGVARVRGLSLSSDGLRAAFAGLTLSSQIWAQPIAPDGSPSSAARALTSDTSRRNSLPAVSRDGSKVAYVSTRGGEPPNIWVMDIDGRNGIQVTSDESDDLQPFWLDDHRRVGYLSNRKNTRGVWTVDIATRREELLIDTTGKQRPDGELGSIAEFAVAPSLTRAAMAFVSRPAARRRIFVTPLQNFAPRLLSDPALWVGYPAWSPDERTLAVEVKQDSSTQAAVLDVETGALRQLTSGRGQTWVRSWSPDGRKIATAAFRDGLWNLRWIDAVSGQEGTISPPEEPRVYVRYPDWSARGDLIVFERGELRGNIWTLSLGQPNATIIDR